MPSTAAAPSLQDAFLKLAENAPFEAVFTVAQALKAQGLDVTDPVLVRELWRKNWISALRSLNDERLAWLEAQGIAPVVRASFDSPKDGFAEFREMFKDGPFRMMALSKWVQKVGEVLLEFPPLTPEDPDYDARRGHYMGFLRQLLLLREWDLAHRFRETARLDINDWYALEKTSLARLDDPKAWEWFLQAGGDPLSEDENGDPAWFNAARHYSQGPFRPVFSLANLKELKASPAAKAWAQKNQPEQFDRLMTNDYLHVLREVREEAQKAFPGNKNDSEQDLNRKAKGRAHLVIQTLTSRPNWLNIYHPSGLPAFFIAVVACPAILVEWKDPPEAVWGLTVREPDSSFPKGKQRWPWELDRLPPGAGLWDLMITQVDQKGNHFMRALKRLAQKVPLPSPGADRTGWLLKNRGCSESSILYRDNDPPLPSVWKNAWKERPDLFWQGTPKQQDQLAYDYWNYGHWLPFVPDLFLAAMPHVTPKLRGALIIVYANTARTGNHDLGPLKQYLQSKPNFEWPEDDPDLPKERPIRTSYGLSVLSAIPEIEAWVREIKLHQVSLESPSSGSRRSRPRS